MTAFLTSIIVTLVLTGVVFWEAKRRPPGSRLSWGEAILAAWLVFFLFLMAYGVVPDRWLRWADGELKWRPDKIGIPLGPFGHWLYQHMGIGSKKNLLAPNGVKFGGRGKITINAQDLRDVVATAIYGVFIGMHAGMWLWWQKRGKKAEKAEVEPVSAYGRPLVRTN